MRAVLQAVAATPFAEAIVNTSVVGSCGDVTATIALPLSAAAADRVALDIDGDGIFGEIECAVADLERIGAAVSTAIAAAKNAGLLRSGA